MGLEPLRRLGHLRLQMPSSAGRLLMDLVAWLRKRLNPNGAVRRAHAWLQRRRFPGSGDYWEALYANGGNSGDGSYGESARFKAAFLNDWFRRRAINSVIEFGHGDGSQASMLEITRYRGYDVSATAVARCRERFRVDSSKSFHLVGDYAGETADAALSLDVIYHLVEDAVFDRYMQSLFAAAERYVVFYSTDDDAEGIVLSPQVRHRRLSRWMNENAGDFRLEEQVAAPPGVALDPPLGLGFYVYARR